MELELVIWHDNVSGTTHICKRTSDGRDVHLTPQSATEQEKNLIEEMCNRVASYYDRGPYSAKGRKHEQ